MKKVLFSLFVLCMMIRSVVAVENRQILAQGNCGAGKEAMDTIIYTIYSDGVLELTGTGATFAYAWGGGNQPFKEYRNFVKEIVIGEGITQIGSGLFCYFTSLENIQMPSTLKNIGATAFMGAFSSDHAKLTIPKTVTSLGAYAFGRRYSSGPILEEVIIENPNIVFSKPVSNVDEAGINYSTTIFNSGKHLTTLKLYSYGSDNNVSKYAKEIGATYIDLNHYTEGTLDEISYLYHDGILTLKGLTENAVISEGNVPWPKEEVVEIKIEENIQVISKEAFKDYVSLEKVKLGKDILRIEDGAFSMSSFNDHPLKMKIPYQVKELGKGLFEYRENVTLEVYVNSEASSYNESGVTLELIQKFKILLIGNSYSLDASNQGQLQMLDIFQAMMGEETEIEIGVFYNSGRTVAWHASKARSGEEVCPFYILSSETRQWKAIKSKASTAYALSYTDWDVVTIQPHGSETTTGLYNNSNTEEYHADLDLLDLKVSIPYMLDFIDQYASQALVYYYLSWPTSNSATMYVGNETFEKMLEVANEAIAYSGKNQSFSGLIPVGTAIQNARATYLALLDFHRDGAVNLENDKQIGLMRDGWHVTYHIGRYIAALTFAQIVLPKELVKEEYILPNISDSLAIGKMPQQYTEIAQYVVEKAIKSLTPIATNPYQVSPLNKIISEIENKSFHITHVKDTIHLQKQFIQMIVGMGNPDLRVSIESFEETESTFTAIVQMQYGYEQKSVTIQGTYELHPLLLGDVNGDGEVNPKDRMILTRYLAQWNGYDDDLIYFRNADVNQDGVLNPQDRMILTRSLAKWSGYELY